MTAARNLASFGGIVGDMVGELKMWPTTTAPTGYLLCNGAAVSRSTYAALFAIVGTTFGAGNGSTTFNLPNYVDRMPIGAGSAYSVAGTGGSKDAVAISHTHTFSATSGGQSQSHSHAVTVDAGGAHTHTYKTYGLGNSGIQGNAYTNNDWGWVATGNPSGTAEGSHSHSASSGGASVDHSHSVSGTTASTGSSGTGANLPPYIGISFIIRYV